MGLSVAPDYLRDDHNLDDVLSAALEDRSNRWLDSPLRSLAVALLLRAESARDAPYENDVLRKNEHFHVCRDIESGAARRALKRKLERRAEIAYTFWNAALRATAFVHGHDLGKHVQRFAQRIPRVCATRDAVADTAGPNDVARFLAGMPVPENSPLAPLTRDPAWQEHAAFLKASSAKLNLASTSKAARVDSHVFSRGNAAGLRSRFTCSAARTFLRRSIFSQTPQFTCFAARKSMGPPPDPLRIANLSGALGNLENAMKSSLNTTYFITKDMKIDLQRAEPQWRVADSLRVHRARRQIDHECRVRLAQQQRRI